MKTVRRILSGWICNWGHWNSDGASRCHDCVLEGR